MLFTLEQIRFRFIRVNRDVLNSSLFRRRELLSTQESSIHFFRYFGREEMAISRKVFHMKKSKLSNILKKTYKKLLHVYE